MEPHRRSGDPPASWPTKPKLRASTFFSCCFRGATTSAKADDHPTTSLIRSSFTWLRSVVPDIGDRCWSIISRFRRSRRRYGEFRYDPLDYALNFDDGDDNNGGDGGGLVFLADGFRCQDFMSRLPNSPVLPPSR
ncbi:uncharacterized protein LOC120279500 [Dioscorea cayenensis subsp. rotundata]|uniref:Uncharacterized protein LOC120279500 n=1 Tax=Dioscorea cayennensis subsp. rotundata TaxID=55577 RepID=A0AB40CQR3_DIOCR|nr:uncharacterized protein LOC120279500 [Dioscorea cayenensis subsp. rotundata]